MIKYGKIKSGSQRYICRTCKKIRVENYAYLAYKGDINQNINQLTKEGLGIRSTARILKISTKTLLKRIVIIARNITKPIISKGKTYEVDIKNNNEKFFIHEIVEDKILGYTHKGIYRLYTNKSPSFMYIILKKGKNFRIIDLKNFSKSLKEISEFLSSGFSDKVVAKYLEEILKVYNYNDYDEKISM
ncbi:hypothetical protein [Flavobacterium sp. FlaQc-47]|uniref:hypothetical protein n=1 Tax=Flavobacterium sp. FlaQc-47 TaxID=3374180 RepID=UPI0037569A9F